MTTSYTSLLGLALPVTGELSGTWGDTVNNGITSLVDSAVAGTTTLSSDADVTLTTTTGAGNQARQAVILWTANGTTTRVITAPAQSKTYLVINASAGTQSIKLVGVGPTTGVTILKGETALCVWNGSDFIKASNTAGAATFTSVTDTGLTSGRVTYAGTSGLLQDSANLTFNGTTLTANTIGAFILSGNITQTGNPSINIGTGALTAGATAVTTLSASGALTYGGVTLSNSVTGTGSMVLSASPTFTGTLNAAAITASGALSQTLNSNTTTGLATNNSSNGTLARNGLLATADAADGFFGVNSSGYTGVSGWADAGIININNASNGLILGLDGVTKAQVTSTGLAVTGALSATGSLSLTGLTDHYVRGGAALFWNSTGASGGTTYGYIQTTTGSAMTLSASGGITLANNTSVSGMITGTALTANGAVAYKAIGRNPQNDAQIAFFQYDGTTSCGLINAQANGIDIYSPNGTKVLSTTNTDVAVTGALSATGKAVIQGQLQVSGAFTADIANSITLAMNTSEGRLIIEGPNTSTKGTFSILLANSNGTAFVTPYTTDTSGYNYFTHPTTGASANAVIDSSTGLLQRSTSSLRYKIDIEPITDSSKVLQLQTIWYRSNPDTCPFDNPKWSWYSFSAEQAAEIDPRFVFWTKDADGKLIPDSVQDRPIVAMLVEEMKKMNREVQSLRSRVALLEAK